MASDVTRMICHVKVLLHRRSKGMHNNDEYKKLERIIISFFFAGVMRGFVSFIACGFSSCGHVKSRTSWEVAIVFSMTVYYFVMVFLFCFL